MVLKERLIPIDEIEYLCVWAWKRRTGWIGGVAANLSSKFAGRISKWEHRSVVVCGTTLSYYETGNEDGTPRGTIDLVADQATIQMCKPEKDAPSTNQVVIKTSPPPPPPMASTPASPSSNSASAPPADGNGNAGELEPPPSPKQPVEWKFCFDEQQDLMRFIEILNKILDNAGRFESKDTSRFEHQFQAGDHIYRWEMIVCPPVIYPIQIHGIVLEAGYNCLIVADFGLTGYSRKKGQDFNHSSDEDHQTNAVVMAAFRKLRPKDVTQRLHIVTLTDPKEIRKWIKAGYDEESMLAKAKAASGGMHHLESLSKVFKRGKRTVKKKENGETSAVEKSESTQNCETDDDENYELPTIELSSTKSTEENDAGSEEGNKEAEGGQGGAPEDGTSKRRPKQQQSQQQSQQQLSNELPQSDPKEIVLARANFVLEHMEVLPPYHVFFSNSECIAVWCKTGHWCTLQTAVWCGTNSVGAFKTSTLTTIGVAAANPLLAPVVAVGGLVWVSAPMVILQKSKVKWEEATKKMTNLFWEWAPPIVFVSAIENWAGMTIEGNPKTATGDSIFTDNNVDVDIHHNQEDEQNHVNPNDDIGGEKVSAKAEKEKNVEKNQQQSSNDIEDAKVVAKDTIEEAEKGRTLTEEANEDIDDDQVLAKEDEGELDQDTTYDMDNNKLFDQEDGKEEDKKEKQQADIAVDVDIHRPESMNGIDKLESKEPKRQERAQLDF